MKVAAIFAEAGRDFMAGVPFQQAAALSYYTPAVYGAVAAGHHRGVRLSDQRGRRGMPLQPNAFARRVTGSVA